MPQLPTPLRAAVGLAASAMDEARRLPERAIELPMLAVSTALQISLRAQQRYAHLAARGDELLNHREVTDEPPPWATFDDPVAVDQRSGERRTNGERRTTAGRRAGEGTAAGDAAAKPARKSVRKPRQGKPSAFDAIGDE